MILYPAIDLKGGQCVRLKRGDMKQATVFNPDPVAQAKTFAEAGAQYLHIVDLDGAIEGHAVNEAAVKAVLAAVNIPVQLGGGIRDRNAVLRWLRAGVSRVIIGTIAVRDAELAQAVCREFGERIVLGIDMRRNRVAIEGWVQLGPEAPLVHARRFEDTGIGAIIFTDIERDGTMLGVNVAATVEMAKQVKVPVIASGGVSSLDDIRALKDAGIPGAILGRSLYEGRFDLREALAVAA